MRSIRIGTLLPLIAASLANAQSLNVDVGNAAGVPAENYGAAAGLVGSWTSVPAHSGTQQLVDLAGEDTTATLTSPLSLAVWWDQAGTAGDDGRLLDDLGDPGSQGQYRFDGLENGGYEVWTYAWAPDDPNARSLVFVTGASEAAKTVGGAWTSGMQEGVTHCLHHVVVTDGTLRVDVLPAAGSSFASVNGFQLIHTGEVVKRCTGSANGYCPCGNSAPPNLEGGCENGAGGWAELGATGTSLVSSDDLRLFVAGATPNGIGLVVQGEYAVEWPFQDGLLCVGGRTERIEVLALDVFGGASTTVSIVEEGRVQPGDRRHYQLWYLDPLTACGTGVNTSNAVQVDWM